METVLRHPCYVRPGNVYGRALALTKRIIDEADPEGLLAMGAPGDEYDSYAADVARRLVHGEDPALIVGSWSRWDGERSADWCIEQLREAQRELLS